MTCILSGIVFFICFIDLGCKAYIEKHMDIKETKTIWNQKVVIQKVYNRGMMLNVLERYPLLVKFSSIFACSGLIIYYIRLLVQDKNWMKRIGVTFMLGGALSNLYDRIIRQYVVDYFSFQTKWKRWNDIVFNIGDMFIFLGSIFVMLGYVFAKRKR